MTEETQEAESGPGSPAKPAGRKRGLGSGLSSLLGDAAVVATTGAGTHSATSGAAPGDERASKPAGVRMSELGELPVEWINSGPWQPRMRFNKASLRELADSIREKGLVQPVLVRPKAGSRNRYELIAGERRWRAAQMAKLHKVPAIIRDVSDEQAHEIAIIENVQRADLSAVEEAEGYRQLVETFGHTQERLARVVGKSRSHVANLLRLLHLPEGVKKMVVEGTLSMGQVRPLIGHERCEELAREIASKGLNARQAEALAAKPAGEAAGKATNSRPEKSADLRRVERRALEVLGLKLDVAWNEAKGRGRMNLHFSSLEQFEDVMAKLGIDQQ